MSVKETNVTKMGRGSGNGGCILGSVGIGMELELSNGRIENNNATGGDGGGVYVSLLFTGKVNVTSMILNDNNGSSENGKGGGIYLSLNAETPTLTLASLSLTNNNAKVGRDLFLSSMYLASIVNSSSFGWHSSVMAKENTLMGNDGISEGWNVDLFWVVEGMKAGVVYVGAGGVDKYYCGYAVYPCMKVSNGTGHLNEIGGREVNVMTSASETERADLSDVVVKSNSTTVEATITFVNDLGGLLSGGVVNNGDLRFERICLSFGGSVGVNRLVYSSGSSLTFTNCSFNPSSSSVSFTLVEVSDGILTLTNTNIAPSSETCFSSSYCPFVISTRENVVVTISSFGNVIIENGALFCSSSLCGCLSVSECEITKIVGLSGLSCVFNSSSDLSTQSVIFDDVSVTASNMSPMFAELEESSISQFSLFSFRFSQRQHGAYCAANHIRNFSLRK
jgi:hypothetical protein